MLSVGHGLADLGLSAVAFWGVGGTMFSGCSHISANSGMGLSEVGFEATLLALALWFFALNGICMETAVAWHSRPNPREDPPLFLW